MLNKAQVWRQISAGLKPGMFISTWSERDGSGPEFKIEEVSNSAILIAPESSGKARRLVQASFDEIVDYRNAGSARTELKTRNSSYALGILKHLGIIQ